MEHVVKLALVAEAHTSYANLGQQVVFANLAPAVVTIVVPVAVQSGVIEVGGDVAVGLMAAATQHVTIETTIGDVGHVAAKVHHHDAVVLVFLDDVVTQFLGVVLSAHRAEDGLEVDDSGAEATSLIETYIFVKRGDILLLGDHEDVVAAHGATSVVVGLQHLGVLGETLGTFGVAAVEPQLAALVGLGSGRRYANGGLGGITHFAGAGYILHRCESREGETDAVQVLCAELTIGLGRVDALRDIEGLVLLKLTAHGVGVCACRLVREEVVVACHRLEIGEFHFDADGFCALGQHKADALPRQRRLTRKGALHAVSELDLFVALDLAHVRLTEIVGLLNGLRRSEQADHQGKEDENCFFHCIRLVD